MFYHFEWDPIKAENNANKHGITFELASEVFKDPMALTIYDEEHSNDNDERWITLGQIQGQHYLVVVHTYQDSHHNKVTVRLISARPATKHEIMQYEQGE